MYKNLTRCGLFGCFISLLCLSACGKKSSSENAPPSLLDNWDAKADKNSSDLIIKDIEP